MPLTVQHAKSNIVADFTGTVTLNNSSGGTFSTLASDLVRPSDWNSEHNYSLALSASEIASLFNIGNGLTSSTDANGISVGYAGQNFFEPIPLPNTNSTLSAPGIGTWYFDPVEIPARLDSGRINLFVSNAAGFLNGAVFSAASTGSVTAYQTLNDKLAFYKIGSGASSTRLETVWTGDCSMLFTWERRVSSAATSNLTVSNYLTASFPALFDGSGGVTYSTTSQSGSTSTGASTGASTLPNNLITGVVAYVSGGRVDPVAMATRLAPGQYWLAHMFTSSSSTTGTNYGAGTMMSTQSRLGYLENSMQAYKSLGSSVSNTSSAPQLYHGFLATTTASASSIAATSNIRGTTGRAYWNYQK